MSDSDDGTMQRSLHNAGAKRSRDRQSDDSEDAQDSEDEGATPARKRRSGVTTARSDSESDNQMDFEDGYGSDLMGDDADREKLAAMNELDREMVIAERAEARDDARERAALLNSQRRPSRPTAAAKATRTSRAKKPDQGKETALQELKAARVRKAQTRREVDQAESSGDEAGEGSSEARHAAEVAPDSEDEPILERNSDDDMSGDEGIAREVTEDEDDVEATLSDAEVIVVKRATLEAWLKQPFLARTLPGCLLRLSLGQKRDFDGNMAATYMVAEVVEVESQKAPRVRDATGKGWDNPYQFGPRGGKTALWVRVRRGDSQRLMPFALVSNSPPTEKEFDSYQKEQVKAGRSMLTTSDVAKTREKILGAEKYKLTAEDVQAMIDAKRSNGMTSNTAAERARMKQLLDFAKEKGNADEVDRLQEQLSVMEAEAASAAARAKGVSMSSINERNTRVNFQNALQNVSTRDDGSSVGADGTDVFARRKTASRNYWSTNRHGGSIGETTEALDPSTAAAAATEAATVAAAAADEDPSAQVHCDDATGAVHIDFDLKALSAPPPPLLARRLLGMTWRASLSPFAIPSDVGARRQLTLADYMRRQNLQQT